MTKPLPIRIIREIRGFFVIGRAYATEKPRISRIARIKKGLGWKPPAHLGFLGARTGCPMPLGFDPPHPSGTKIACHSGTTAWDGFVGILWGQILAASDRRSAPRSDLNSYQKKRLAVSGEPSIGKL